MRLVVLIALVFIPLVAAGPGQDVRHYTVPIAHVQTTTGAVPLQEVNATPYHAWSGGNGTTTLRVYANYDTVAPGFLDPDAWTTFQVRWDQENVAGCRWTVTGTGASVHHHVPCVLDGFQAGNHTVLVFVADSSGTAIEQANVFLQLEQNEAIQMQLDVNVTPDILAHLVWLLWGLYLLVTNMLRNPMMRVLAAFVGFGLIALPLDPEQFVFILVAQSLVTIYQSVRLITNLE